MTNSEFEYPQDFNFKCKGKLSINDFEVDFIDNVRNSCVKITKHHKSDEESKD